jgi:hypothetical protein
VIRVLIQKPELTREKQNNAEKIRDGVLHDIYILPNIFQVMTSKRGIW